MPLIVSTLYAWVVIQLRPNDCSYECEIASVMFHISDNSPTAHVLGYTLTQSIPWPHPLCMHPRIIKLSIVSSKLPMNYNDYVKPLCWTQRHCSWGERRVLVTLKGGAELRVPPAGLLLKYVNTDFNEADFYLVYAHGMVLYCPCMLAVVPLATQTYVVFVW